jgi:hypothetical protein
MWFVILAAVVMIALTVPGADSFQRIMFLATAIFMAVFGYFVFRKLVLDIVDEVIDEGDSLVVKNRGNSDRIAPFCFVPFASHPVINKLIERIDAASRAG